MALASALLVVCLWGGLASANPVVGVIELLHDLQSKVKEEGQAEELQFEKFQHWCTRGLKTLHVAISQEQASNQALGDKLVAGDYRIKSLQGEIDDLTEQIHQFAVKDGAASRQREEQEQLYNSAVDDLVKTVRAIDNALQEVERQRPASLAELQRPQLLADLAAAGAHNGGAQRPEFAELLQALTGSGDDPDIFAAGDQAAHVKTYKWKSGHIVELLKKLQSEFSDDLTELHKAERNQENSYRLVKAARTDLDVAAQGSLEAKEKALSNAVADMGVLADALHSGQADLSADTQERKATNAACAARSDEWMKRSEIRASEREAMAAAIDILAKVTGVQTKAPKGPGKPIVLLQISDPRMKAVNLLRATADATHSKALAQLAQHLSVHPGESLGEISGMIEKLIFRLMDEQKHEDEHKAWCNVEVAKTEKAMSVKAEKLEDLGNREATLMARAGGLASEIATADGEVSGLAASIEEATALRQESKAENAAALEDAENAQNAIAQAVAVLEIFYKQAGDAAFVQEPVDLPDSPSLWSSAYTGVANPKAQPDGIIAVLNELSAKFSTMEANVKAQEAAEKQAFQADMSASMIDRARHTEASKVKGAERKSVISQLSAVEENHKRIAAEHRLVDQYGAQLDQACKEGDGKSTYKSRKAARKQEADALRQAQGILEGPAGQKAFLAIRSHVART